MGKASVARRKPEQGLKGRKLLTGPREEVTAQGRATGKAGVSVRRQRSQGTV